MRVTLGFSQGYVLHLIAPDESVSRPSYEKPVWQLLIEGTPDPRDAEEGFFFPANVSSSDLAWDVINTLYNNISSSVVDTNRTMIEEAVKKLYFEFYYRKD